ncbi:MAG TPA: MFS transporter [bacterium]|nr:MFS transporter [bacterium]
MTSSKSKKAQRRLSPWFWVPSLYFAEGIPYIVVMIISVIMYKRMGISNTDIALYTSWLYLPWVIKPLWSPVVDLFKTKRLWIIVMQLFIGAGLACVAFTIPVPNFFQFTLAFFWLLAFNSATHDIAADGFYMLGLTEHQQAWFVGVRSTFYRFAMLTGQGLLVILAGYIESHSGLESVEINVQAVNQTVNQRIVSPDSLEISPLDGDLRIITHPQKLEITIEKKSRHEIDQITEMVKQWNANFMTTREAEKKQDQSTAPSWWQRNVVVKIESGFRAIFGSDKKIADRLEKTGNVRVIYFYLSRQPEPDRTIVVNFGRESGDKSINLIEGARREFTAANWNQPLMSLIQLDPKLKQPTSADFVARAGNIPLSWMVTFGFMAILFLFFSLYHHLVLPYPKEDSARTDITFKSFFKDFANTFVLFFKKDKIGLSIAFLLLYRLGESQLVKIASPFLLDTQELGGLGLTTGQVGFVYGTVGIAMLTVGGLLGGFLAARHGLKKWLIWMAIAINVPDVVYIYLAQTQTANFFIINLCVGIEQLGYGFGFTAYMLYMILISEGKFKTAHFAITTAFMALGMMLPGMISGWIQELIGYYNFFVWVLISTIPGIILVNFLPIDPEFGKRQEK